jgi:general secretion pathway protein N
MTLRAGSRALSQATTVPRKDQCLAWVPLGNAVIRVMRLLGTLLVSSVPVVPAAADAIDDQVDLRPQVEALSPNAQGKGDAAPPGAGLAPRRNATPRTGNPFSSIPLSALSATRDRPLFSVSRRPPDVPVVPPPPKQEAQPTPPPEQPSFTLMGTIVSNGGSVAVVQGSNADAISRLRVGEENNGWRVQGIGLRAIVVEKGAQSIELALPKPNAAPADLPRPDGASTTASAPTSTHD